MLKKKWKKIALAIAVIIALIGAAAIFLLSSSGWDRYTKNDNYVIVEGYKTVIEDGKKEGLDDDQIWTKVVSYAEIVKYPQKELEELEQKNRKNYEELAKASGYSDLESYLKEGMSITLDEFNENSTLFCKNEIAEKLVLYRIAHLEGITVEDTEYNMYLDDLMKLNGFTDESFQEAYGCTFREYADSNGMRDAYLLDLVKSTII